MIEIEIYTDGACSGNPGPGGWSFIILENKEKKISKSGTLKDTTNNRCEMIAVIQALTEIEGMSFSMPKSIKLYSDSAYVVNAFLQGWIDKWKENGWKNSYGHDVKNRELWEALTTLQENNKAEFVQIKRCSNEFARNVDKMAKKSSNA